MVSSSYIISVPDSPGRQSSDRTWDPSAAASAFTAEDTEFILRPGTYTLTRTISVGNGSIVRGMNAIGMPSSRADFIDPDPTIMAVFETRNDSSSEGKKNSSIVGGFYISGKTGITLKDIFCYGFCGIELASVKSSRFERCVVQNRMKDGKWCWHQRTGAIWQHVGCDGNYFKSCITQYSNHHGFLNHTGGGNGWIWNTTFDDCRALYSGCAKEADGSGYLDWSCGFDIAEECDVDGVLCVDCYAADGWKCNFYYEPEITGVPTRGSAFVRRNIVLTNCVAVDGGRSGGGFRGQMAIKEGENCNFYISTGEMTGCRSYRGSKAGFYARVDREFTTLTPVYTDCLDCGSNIGYLLELAGADAEYRNCISVNAVKWAWKLMGDETVIDGCKVRMAAGQTEAPFYLGGYTRVYLQDSRDPNSTALVEKTIAEDWWSIADLTINACIAGLPNGVSAYWIHEGNSQQTTGVAIATSCPSAIPESICDVEDADTNDDPTPLVTASFTLTPSSGPAPLTVQFTDTSTGGPVGWNWQFGDGAASTEQNPSHTYTAAGTYNVQLSARDSAGEASTVTRNGAVVVGGLDGVYFRNARVTPSSGPYGTRFTLIIEPHRGPA